MLPNFRRAIGSLVLLMALPVLAQSPGDWPSRPVHIVIPFAPGGTADAVGRIMAQRLSDTFHQPFVAENRPGASGNIGAAEVARSKPDGYTILLGTTSTSVTNQFVIRDTPFDSVADFVPITLAARFPLVLVASPSIGVKTLDELIHRAKQRPGALSFGHSGAGTLLNLSMELLKSRANIDLVAVPYKGSGPMMQDLLGGHIQLAIDQTTTTLPHIRSGKLVALAVTSTEALPELPQVPTVGEKFPGFEAVSLFPLMVPAHTPAEIVKRLSAECDRILHMPDTRKQLEAIGAEAVGGSPPEVAAILAAETRKWRQVVTAAGIKPE